MHGDKLDIRVRYALVYYLLKRLNLDFAEEKRAAREQHVVLANRDEAKTALARAQYRTPRTGSDGPIRANAG